MSKIATLGPKGTFCELASNRYMASMEKYSEIMFYPTITKVFNAVENEECELAIIPVENTLDGYVQISLDLLCQKELQIIHELIIPIQFAFVGNVCNISDVEKIYAQFKTQGQCYGFLEQLTDAKIITTESNGESLERVKEDVLGEAAVIPEHILKEENKFSLIIDNVTDSKENETRFIVLSKDIINYNEKKKYKTSIIIMNTIDEPGALFKILNEFSEKNINLSSIISRPTKKALGKYFFFIDIEGHYPKDENVKQAIDKISKKNIVKILGSYPLI